MTSTSNGDNLRHPSISSFETPIEDALKSNSPLLSWKSVYYRLNRAPQSVTIVRNLRKWLQAGQQVTALSSCYTSIPPQNSTSRQAFETKTSQINITADTVLPITEIKEDALRLSQELSLDELEALKICILEYQERSPSLGMSAEDPRNATEPSITLPNISMWGGSRRGQVNGDSKSVKETDDQLRTSRQVKLYFSERRYRIKAATALVRIAVTERVSSGRRHPLYVTAVKLCRKMMGSGQQGHEVAFVEAIISELERKTSQSTVPAYFSGKGFQKDVDSSLQEWERQVLMEEYHLLQLLFVLMCSLTLPSAPIVSKWFKCMRSTSFLADHKFLRKPHNTLHEPLLNTIIPLGSLVSLTMISLPIFEQHLVEDLDKKSAGSNNNLPALYIESPETVKLVHDVLTEFVIEKALAAAALAGWAWAIGLSLFSSLQAEVKDQRSDGNLEADHAPGSDVLEQTLTRYEKSLGAVTASSRQAEGPAFLLASGSIRAGLLDVVEQLVIGLPGPGGWSLQAEEDGERMQNMLAEMMRLGMAFFEFEEKALQAFIVTYSHRFTPKLAEAKFHSDESNDEEPVEDAPEERLLTIPAATQSLGNKPTIFTNFWSDRIALSRTIHIARCRFPYETLPFAALIHAVTPREITSEPFNLGYQYLAYHMDSFTIALPPYFRGTEVDENDPSNIILTEPLTVVAQRRTDRDGAFILPAGIVGKIISVGVSPPIVRWDFHYSGVQYIGRLLEKILLEEEVQDFALAVEILGVFDNVLTSYIKSPIIQKDGQPTDTSPATALLEEASDLLASNNDIISVVLDLFEASLPYCVKSKSLDLTVACLRLINTLLPILPGRIWPYLDRSSLLERNGRGGLLTRILESVEIVKGDYTFLLECLTLYESLLQDAVSGVVHSGTIGSAGSIVGGAGVGAGVSIEVQTSILHDWTRFWCSVYESFTTWKYLHVRQRLSLNFGISSTFSRILETVYGISSDENHGFGLFQGLAPSASHISGAFLTPSPSLAVEPILLSVSEGLETVDSTTHSIFVADWIENIASSLQLGATALKVQHLQHQPPSHLEKQLYGRALDLTSLYATDENYRLPIVELLDSLLNCSEQWTGEPPSILGYLGQSGANKLIVQLQRLGGLLGDERLECAIWNFFRTIVSNKQQGLSIKLVTGNDISSKSGPSDKGQSQVERKKSMLSLALDILRDIEYLPTPLSLALLQAVSVAQDFWGAIVFQLPNYSIFLSTILNYISKLTIDYSSRTNASLTECCNKTAIAAHIAHLLAMYIHQSRYNRESTKTGFKKEFFEGLVQKLTFLLEHGSTISGYKPSMHGLLAFNFGNRWPSCHLENFRKSSLQQREYGVNYYYDIGLAERILSWDRGWDTLITRKSSDKVIETRSGFKADVESVNLNLSLIDSQVYLLEMWSGLALEVASHESLRNGATATALSKTIVTCLQAGIKESLPQTISPALNVKRSGLAFALFKKIQGFPRQHNNDISRVVLDSAWTVVAAVESDFIASLAKGGNEYTRNLLRLLYLALAQTPKNEVEVTPQLLQILVGIFDVVVAKGFKSLANAAYEHRDILDPGDMLIIIGIMQMILAFEGLDPIHEHFVGHLANNGTIRTTTILFTWATKLAEAPNDTSISPDPIFGELSVMFLVKLSSLPVLAEQVALNSIFNSLNEGEIATKLQAGQLLPTSTPRLHNIWAKGFLPLLLNILLALRNRIAPEVSLFLRSFTRQISFALGYINKPDNITLPQLAEIADIVAIVMILEKMGTSSAEEFYIRWNSVETACDQLVNHRAWLSKLLVPTSMEEDALWQNGANGNKLVEKAATQAKLIRDMIVEHNAEISDAK